MDRLFLQGLVAELRPRVVGRRVRSALVDRDRRILAMGLGARSTLSFSFSPDVAGPFLETEKRSGVTTPGLRTRVVSSEIRALECSTLDRIVTLTLDQTKLSGRKTTSALVLEAFGNRVALYLVDFESSTIVEVFAPSRSRQGAGERYEPPHPPPDAREPVETAGELENRLAEARERGLPRRRALLYATGLTPLLVREMEWLVDEERKTEASAFENVRERLRSGEPVRYAARVDAKGAGLLSPVTLSRESSLEARRYGSFSDALADGVEQWARARRVAALRARLDAALAQKLGRARKLRKGLGDDLRSQEEPAELRLRGEKLLAALHRARRSPLGDVVVLPDPFDPDEREIEIAIDPRLSLPANAERFFSRARKSERAAAELSRRMAELDGRIAYWESLECDVRDASRLEELEELEEEARQQGLLPGATERAAKVKKATPRRRLGPRRFRSRAGNVILVGRSGRSNDEATFKIARPEDLWFHAAGIPGAHVVLRLSGSALPEEGELEDAASLAAYFSKGREDTRVDVFVTERRHVSRIKGGPPGLVKVQNVRTLRVVPRLLDEIESDGKDEA